MNVVVRRGGGNAAGIRKGKGEKGEKGEGGGCGVSNPISMGKGSQSET